MNKINLRVKVICAPILILVFGIGAASLGLSAWVCLAVATVGFAISTLLIYRILQPICTLPLALKNRLLHLGIAENEFEDSSQDGDAVAVELSRLFKWITAQYTQVKSELSTRDRQFESCLYQVAFHLNGISRNQKHQLKNYSPESPWAEKNYALSAALSEAQAANSSSLKRISTLLNILNDVPDPLIVFDQKLALQYLNAAAQDFLDVNVQNAVKSPARQYFVDPPIGLIGNYESTLALKSSEVIQWLHQGRGGSCEALAQTGEETGTPVLINTLPLSERRNQQAVVLLMKDISDQKRAEQNTRQLHRRLIGQRLSLMIARETGPSLDIIRTQSGLLSQASKQLGQHERFLPKIQRIIEEVNKHELVINLLGWLGRLTTTAASEPETEELKLKTVVEECAAKLAGSFSERGNRFEIQRDAGWLIGDENRISIMVTGLVVHANLSVEQSTITLDLGRRSSVTAAEELCEIIVRYKSPMLSQQIIDDIRDPFRRINSSIFDSNLKNGFLLGPAVANRVIGLMNGTLEFEHDSEFIVMRAVLPTRERTNNRLAAQAAATTAQVAMAESVDTLSAWSIGGKATENDSNDDDSFDENILSQQDEQRDDLNVMDDSIGSFFG